MPDYTKVIGIACGDISKISGVSSNSISKVSGQTSNCGGAAGASRLVAAFDDAYVSWVDIADDGDVTVWESNMYKAGATGDSWDIVDIAYGKDGSGDPFYVAVAQKNNPEIIYDDDGDITDGVRWGEVNVAGNLKQKTVAWGNDVWVSAGLLTASTQHIYRSTNGSTWSTIDISGLTDINNVYTAGIYGLTTDGNGTWWFALKGKIYKSTDNASSWALEHTVSVGGGKIWDLVYTNSTLVCLYASGGAYIISAAASDTTDWSAAVALTDANNASLSTNNTRRMAGGGGRVVARDTARTLAADVSGKTITIQGTRQDLPDEGNLNCICTDGEGNWWTGSDGGNSGPNGGDICKSTDNGMSWTKIAEGINVSGDRKVEGIAVDVLLPV